MRLTAQIQQLGTETAFEVLARAKRLEAQGRTVLHLEIGEPDFPTPPHIVEAGSRALWSGATKYAPAAGLAELREAIAQWVSSHELTAAPENVLVTSGAKPMLFYALTALIEAGDEVLIPDPGFPIYESLVRFAFGRPVGYTVDAGRARAVDAAEIARRISHKTKVLVLNSPHNPTGAVLDSATLQVLAQLVERHRLTVVSDEIYSQLVFEGEHRSIASLPGCLNAPWSSTASPSHTRWPAGGWATACCPSRWRVTSSATLSTRRAVPHRSSSTPASQPSRGRKHAWTRCATSIARGATSWWRASTA